MAAFTEPQKTTTWLLTQGHTAAHTEPTISILKQQVEPRIATNAEADPQQLQRQAWAPDFKSQWAIEALCCNIVLFSTSNPFASPSLGRELKQLWRPWAGKLGATTLQLMI